MPVTRMVAIKKVFEADGGQKVEGMELIKFKRDDPKGFEELAEMCAASIGETIQQA